MLRECGIRVARAVSLDAIAAEPDAASAADFILVDLDEAAGGKLDRLLDAVERLGVPVLFNDGSAPLSDAAGGGPELGRRIGLKLTPLAPVAAAAPRSRR